MRPLRDRRNNFDVTDEVDYRGVLADFDPGASRLD